MLDTGVELTNSYFRGVKTTRKKRDSPIKYFQHFIDESINDECGHGTNVAALILKMAPEADLYVAKISTGKETRGTRQIIDVS